MELFYDELHDTEQVVILNACDWKVTISSFPFFFDFAWLSQAVSFCSF